MPLLVQHAEPQEHLLVGTCRLLLDTLLSEVNAEIALRRPVVPMEV